MMIGEMIDDGSVSEGWYIMSWLALFCLELKVGNQPTTNY